MNNVKAKRAMRLPEFRKWMFDEIKITEKEAVELTKCSTCWSNFKWREKTIEKIEAKIKEFKVENEQPEWEITNNRFDEKDEIIHFIKSSNADSFQIVTRRKIDI